MKYCRLERLYKEKVNELKQQTDIVAIKEKMMEDKDNNLIQLKQRLREDVEQLRQLKEALRREKEISQQLSEELHKQSKVIEKQRK